MVVYGTVALYAVVAEAKVGESVPAEIVNPERVASVDGLVTVMV